MDGGRVIEQGTHDHCSAAGGRYSDLWWEEMRTERYADSHDVARHLPALDPDDRPPDDQRQEHDSMTTDLARWQFATTSIYHFLFVPVTIGLAFLVALLQTSWYRNDNPAYRRLTKFFGTLLLINVAVGVVTGTGPGVRVRDELVQLLPLRRQRLRGPLAMEGLVAFFLESTFLGIWIFGWDRLSKKLHLACIWLVAGATMLSAAVHHGRQLLDAAPGRLRDERPAPAACSPTSGPCSRTRSSCGRYVHVILASLVTGALVMLAVSAWHIREGARWRRSAGRRSSRWPSCSPAVFLNMFVGASSGSSRARTSP